MKVNVWIDKHKLVLPSAQQGEKKVVKGTEQLEQPGSMSVELEEVQVPSSSDHEPISKFPNVTICETSFAPNAPSVSPSEQESMLSPLKASFPSFTLTEVVVFPHLMEISLATVDEFVQSIAQQQEVVATGDVLISEIVAKTIIDEAVFEIAGEDVPVVPVIPME